jgi:hypothetical protein
MTGEGFRGDGICDSWFGKIPLRRGEWENHHNLVILGLSQNPGSLVYHFWIPGQARNDGVEGPEATGFRNDGIPE